MKTRALVERRRQNLYFPDHILDEIGVEARRLDRSLSWVVTQAWRVALPIIKQMPGPPP